MGYEGLLLIGYKQGLSNNEWKKYARIFFFLMCAENNTSIIPS